MKKPASKAPPRRNEPPAINLVLNGGKDELQGATIPIQWFFSKELAEYSPTHLILVDKTRDQFSSQHKGRRYLVRVDQAATFLQLHRSGQHRLSVLAFNDYDQAVSHLLKDSQGYREAIDDQLIEVKDAHLGALAGTTVEFTIPAEFFAKEPSSLLGKFFFWYLKWPSRKANDECSIKRAAILALPKLPFFIAWWLLKFIGFMIFLAYMLIAPPIALFIGYQPIYLSDWWARIKDAILYADIDIDICAGERYQLYHDYHQTGYYQESGKLWFSPLDITLFLILTALLSFLTTKMFISGLYMIGFMSGSALLGILINSICTRLLEDWKKRNNWVIIVVIHLAIAWILSLIFVINNGMYVGQNRPSHDLIATALIILSVFAAILIKMSIKKKVPEKKPEEDQPDPGLTYQNYLMLHFTQPKSQVDLKQLPETFHSNQRVRNFRISFWTLKAKVCRPYEQ
ncbi:MAG: hypothetical protein WC441_01165 [Patescibacteria group bacterium]